MKNGVVCDSKIESVTVYARGASIRRRATLPGELPDGACDVVLEGVTHLADPGSLRASLESGRDVLGVRAELSVPERKETDESIASQLRALHRKREELVAERQHAMWRRELLASVHPEPELVRRVAAIDPAERVADALAVVGLVGSEMEAIDTKIADLTADIEKNDRDIESASARAAQASAAESKADAPPELRVIVHLGPKVGGETPDALDVEYTVLAARWWPSYRARFTDSATRVSLSISALVAQLTGEDWTGVRILLSTGDLLRDVRLPEITSLRLGRAQRPAARGYRAPPEGLDTMFDGFDRFVAQVSVTASIQVVQTTSVTASVDSGAVAVAAAAPWQGVEQIEYEESTDDLDEPTEVAQMRDLVTRKARGRGAPARHGIAPQAPGFGGAADAMMGPPPAAAGAMSPPRAAVSLPMEEAPVKAKKSVKIDMNARLTKTAFDEPQSMRAKSSSLFGLSGLMARDEPTLAGIETEGLPIEPADAWLDFDSLRLDPDAPRGARGRLARKPGPSTALALAAAQQIESIETPAGTTDPRASRGLFDALYTASGTADIPSNGRPHRVTVRTAESEAAPRFVAVPREAPEVYRRADIKNPFGLPLLTGPVEVLIDGALVALTRLSYTDRDGTLSIGLGVEERVKVARNARIEEGTAGLLGGSTTVDHSVTTELSSSLGRKIHVEVIDRLPVSDDKDVEIKMLGAEPVPEPYTQAELGQPVRKGLLWKIEVPPGGKAKVEHRYRIVLPSKFEVVGGNRRE